MLIFPGDTGDAGIMSLREEAVPISAQFDARWLFAQDLRMPQVSIESLRCL